MGFVTIKAETVESCRISLNEIRRGVFFETGIDGTHLHTDIAKRKMS